MHVLAQTSLPRIEGSREMARIIIVDDDARVRLVIARMLTRAGHDAVEVPSGVAALEAYRQQPADLVISDMFMPDTDGVEITRRLRREFPDAKVVAISGGGARYGKELMLETAAALGAVRTLAKPFRTKELLSVVKDALVSV